MDGEENYQQKEETCEKHGLGSTMQTEEESVSDNSNNPSTHADLGDMTFYMTNYLKDAMKMMFMMRSHHMLTDVILEVGTELFHAHKVILAAASPYFKVRIFVNLYSSHAYISHSNFA